MPWKQAGCAVWLGLLAAAAFSRPAAANVVAYTLSGTGCTGGGGPGTICTDTTLASNQIAGATTPFIDGGFPRASPQDATFTTAFDNWNAANGGGWTLVDGGTLNLDLNFSLAPGAGATVGGVNPVIVELSNYQPAAGGPGLGQLVWTQALFANYAPTVGMLSTPTVTLDTYSLSQGSPGSNGAFQAACTPIPGQSPGPGNTTPAVIGATPSGSAYCDPIYPFQYGQSTADGPDPFADAPAGPWPDASFRAIALLSTVTFGTDSQGAVTSRVLTVYQGVEYGFTLSIAEPGSAWLLLAGAALLPALRARRPWSLPRPG